MSKKLVTNRLVSLQWKHSDARTHSHARESIFAAVCDLLSGAGRPGKVPELWDSQAAERIIRILQQENTQ